MSTRAEYPCAPDGADQTPIDRASLAPDGPERNVNLPDELPVTIVIVSEEAGWRARVIAAAGQCGCAVVIETCISSAKQWLFEPGQEPERPTPMLVVDHALPGGEAMGLTSGAHRVGITTILTCGKASRQIVAQAGRCGADDVLDRSVSDDELRRRLGLAIALARAAARQSHRVTRLQRICRCLSEARRQVVRQAGAIWTDLTGVQREQSEHMNQATLSSEYGGLIRQELDLEVLLRTTLEYVLGKSGPTNAAVFLPSTSGDFTLGAYVNYDCPKETVDILLDHMANVVAPRFEHVDDISHLTDPKEIKEQVAGDAMWIGDAHVIGFSCKHEGECLAIFLFFREAHTPYPATFVNQLRVVRDLFAAQLARIIRIHHRHLPKEQWGALGDPPRDESDDGMV